MPTCKSCGAYVPDGQRELCSMCYGDPSWGRDGYYDDYLRQMEERQREQQQEPEGNVKS